MTPAPPTAEAIYRRQAVVAATSGIVVLTVVGGVVLAMQHAPGTGWVLAFLAAGVLIVAALFAFVVRHALRVARFTFRNEVR